MSERYVNGCDTKQELILPETLEKFVDEYSGVPFVDAFVDSLDLVRRASLTQSRVLRVGLNTTLVT